MIGVIIPTFNSEKYLKECLDSVFASTIAKDLYIILVDNCSTDDTFEIALKYKVDFVHMREPHNIGVARNLGLIKAIQQECDCVAMVDSDDTITPSYLQDMHSVYSDGDTDWVTSDFCINRGTIIQNVVLPDNANLEVVKNYNPLSAFIFTKPELLLSVGGYSPMAIAEDWELWYRLIMMGCTYKVNHKGGYNYRMHGESSSDKKSDRIPRTINVINSYSFSW